MCGLRTIALVMDHDHMTGLCRGLLCRGCNAWEARSDAPQWAEWRAGLNPAGILGIVEEYEHLFPSQAIWERMTREPFDDAALDLIADAVVNGRLPGEED